MARLNRAQTQERTRARVLAAAREEFAEKGFRAARIDAVAERAELTRGAVYSNFPGKRALYFTVLAERAERAPAPPATEAGGTAREALGALARTWVARLPGTGFADAGAAHGGVPPQYGEARIDVDALPEILADARLAQPFVELMKLDALLLALALEHLRPPRSPEGAPPGRLVRLAETVLTSLHGARQLAAAAPGFVQPFDMVSAAERLCGLELNDWWAPPPVHPPARAEDRPWQPPAAVDAVRAAPAPLHEDGIVAVLGLHRLSAAEEAVRAAPPGTPVTVVVVTGDPGELMPLARLVVAELCGCLRSAFPRAAWPALRVVCDTTGAVAAAAGVTAVDDDTETAIRIEAGRVVGRADGFGACHAVASARPVGSASEITGPRAADVRVPVSGP
ncbi:helix-turn-helix domain-containing protein [Streptomyces sp. NPDC049585]|uniref:TetR/AcrR family transcriptional regulator n=1 Tax=Streptomyces sp. NPDC049585 TaxID=3155154 RepID=UPI00341F691C